MTANSNNELVPLRNVPIHITVEDVAVSGETLALYPNDMSVIITQPVSGLGTMLHVRAFAMARVNWLATLDGQNTLAVTERGWERAAQLPCVSTIIHAASPMVGLDPYEGWR